MDQYEKLTIEVRRDILNREIDKWIRRGYYILSQSDTTAQLKKDKGFSCLLFSILFILAILPAIIYIFIRKDKTIYITVDGYGRVKEK